MYIIYRILIALIQVEQAAILVHAVLSWIPIQQLEFLYDICERITAPLMNPIRRIVPVIAGLDFSPVVGLILLGLVNTAINNIYIGLVF